MFLAFHFMAINFLLIFCLISLAFAGSHGGTLSEEDHWKSVFPNTPMPKALKDLLPPNGVDVITTKGVNVDSGKQSKNVNDFGNPFIIYGKGSKGLNTNGDPFVVYGKESKGVNDFGNPFVIYGKESKGANDFGNPFVIYGKESKGENGFGNPLIFYGKESKGVNEFGNPLIFYGKESKGVNTFSGPYEKESKRVNTFSGPYEKESKDMNTFSGPYEKDSKGVNTFSGPYEKESKGLNDFGNPFVIYDKESKDVTTFSGPYGKESKGVNTFSGPYEKQFKGVNTFSGPYKKESKDVNIHVDPEKASKGNKNPLGRKHGNAAMNETMYFFQEDLHPGKKVKLSLLTKTKDSRTFLPRELAQLIPFSSDELPQILNHFAVDSESTQANAMELTLKGCERQVMHREQKLCATSFESFVDSSVAKLGKKIKLLANHLGKETNNPIFTIGRGIRNMGEDEVVCHKMMYPYAVFLCHSVGGTVVYEVPLKGIDGTKARALAICHKDTSAWSPDHPALTSLKVKPGTVPVCHFVVRDTLVWVRK